MTENSFLNDPQAVARIESVACLFEWMRSMPIADRKRFSGALVECRDEVQQVVVSLLQVVKDPCTPPVERQRALKTLADALFLNQTGMGSTSSIDPPSSEPQKTNSQEETFAQRLREWMDSKQISQQELANRVGCSQPAISQMLSRTCRPRKKTILRLAEALKVQPSDLWPDIDVADMLDAVAEFQQDDYVMTAAEAAAFADSSEKNRPSVRAKSLPPRP